MFHGILYHSTRVTAMFGIQIETKKMREQREQEERLQERMNSIEYQREKEMQVRISAKRTLASMRKQSEKLEALKKEYIEKAKQASLVGNQQTFKLAKAGLKLCLQKQKFLDSMISNFELSLQISDMNKVIGEFVDGMAVISEQMAPITSMLDMSKAQMAYEKAIANNANQYEALNEFLSTAAESVDSIVDISDVSDDEIDMLITNQVLDSECDLDREIEAKLQDVRQKLNV